MLGLFVFESTNDWISLGLSLEALYKAPLLLLKVRSLVSLVVFSGSK